MCADAIMSRCGEDDVPHLMKCPKGRARRQRGNRIRSCQASFLAMTMSMRRVCFLRSESGDKNTGNLKQSAVSRHSIFFFRNTLTLCSFDKLRIIESRCFRSVKCHLKQLGNVFKMEGNKQNKQKIFQSAGLNFPSSKHYIWVSVPLKLQGRRGFPDRLAKEQRGDMRKNWGLTSSCSATSCNPPLRFLQLFIRYLTS